MLRMSAEELALASFQASHLVSLLSLFGGSDDDDKMVADCHDLVLDAVSNADATRKVECVTGENWRDQLTVEEAEDLRKDADLRRMQNRN